MSRKALVSAFAVTAVAVPVADAHTLSKSAAKLEAQKVGAALVRELGGSPVYQCERRGKHVVDCQISVVTIDASVCVSVVRVSYRTHRSRKVSRRTLSGPDCEPPELGGLP